MPVDLLSKSRLELQENGLPLEEKMTAVLCVTLHSRRRGITVQPVTGSRGADSDCKVSSS